MSFLLADMLANMSLRTFQKLEYVSVRCSSDYEVDIELEQRVEALKENRMQFYMLHRLSFLLRPQ
jgi:hypothetical protein